MTEQGPGWPCWEIVFLEGESGCLARVAMGHPGLTSGLHACPRPTRGGQVSLEPWEAAQSIRLALVLSEGWNCSPRGLSFGVPRKRWGQQEVCFFLK